MNCIMKRKSDNLRLLRGDKVIFILQEHTHKPLTHCNHDVPCLNWSKHNKQCSVISSFDDFSDYWVCVFYE